MASVFDEESGGHVSREQSERLIAGVEGTSHNPRAGLFGPDSVSWRINRESALFLGAGRAALLQLAHPWVAAALEQHSDLMSNPIARFHNTFRIVFTMIFGSLRQATAASRHLYELHTHIQGELTESVAGHARGERYEANETAALRWVYATLVESAVLAYESVLPPLLAQEVSAYYAESKRLAGLFGLSAEALPADWPAFLAYCRAMEGSAALGVSTQARAMADALLHGAGSWVRPPHWYRALTASWLPERLREDFGLPWNDEERRVLQAARRWLPPMYGRLPRALRFVGPWHEAQARLANTRTGWVAQLGNRFWIGQSALPFAH